MQGKVIVIEGSCDGVGKSTQTHLLQESLERDGKEVIYHHFPTYHQYYGVPVTKYLEGVFGNPEDLSPYFINALYANDRACAWYETLKKEYDQGKILLFDRYTTSSLMYQSSFITDLEKKKEFINYVCDFEYNKLGLPRPDLTIYLDMPFLLAQKLRKERTENDGVEKDIHESNMDFLKRVYESGVFVASYLDFAKVKCSDNEEIRSINDIHNDIVKLTRKL